MLALLLPGAARADSAAEFTGLFVQACLQYAGDAAGLRAWAARTGIPTLPEAARAAFLHGAPGEAFDASDPGGKFVLVSSDDGLCSAVTESVTQRDATDALEASLRQAGVDYRLALQRDDKAVAPIHDLEYLATKGKRAWRILLAAVKGGGGEAMLTAAPE